MGAANDLQDQLKDLVLSETDIEVLRGQLSEAIMALGFIAFASGGSHQQAKDFARGVLLSFAHAGERDDEGIMPTATDLLRAIQAKDFDA